ncbi:arginine--tRNA ligase [Candidatus Aerophobetes bacterium]|uniref:Arginine--tRNA ligase n=1 Tax=Aerophobetes bacterium TaxID=2030807 RepID=A0A2A4YFW8_UNCAE|nr:MAG: arginine--tRNA ligase [Candidatus Aerophobetes bacterium]
MDSLIGILQDIASKAIKDAFEANIENIAQFLPAEVTQSTQDKFGHYQCNSALKIAKALKQNPRNVASELIEKLKSISEKDSFIEAMEIAGPGFINITLTKNYIAEQLNKQLKDPHLGVAKPKVKKRIIVEFSSPNIAKELHVGHLRSTIIGESLARLFEFLGHDVVRLNHVGDWGTQFGMLIAFLKMHQKDVLSGKKIPELSDLMSWYKESKKLFDADADFKKTAQLEVIDLQAKNEESLHAWSRICDISREAFKEIYKLLDVTITERGESFYNAKLKGVVEDLEKKKLIVEDQGAKCIFLDGFVGKDKKPLPMIIQKSDGGFNYSTTDMAALIHRVEEEKADRVIYVVDSGQSLHFQMIFKAAEKAGYFDPQKMQLNHVAFGVVLGSDGKKFKTRSGETEKLIDLISTAVSKAKELLKDKLTGVSEEELDNSAEILGIDAIKYADLSCHRLKDYVFSYDRMLKFEGNTAAFLLYAYVRIQSIKKKIGKNLDTLMKSAKISLSHPTELALGLHLCRFEESLMQIDRELLPNRLSDYLFQLAEKFHAFFRDCRVEGVPEEDSRLLLCELTARILKTGLHILGLKTLDRM